MSLEGYNPLPECLAELSAQGEGEEEVDAVIRYGRTAFSYSELFLRFENIRHSSPFAVGKNNNQTMTSLSSARPTTASNSLSLLQLLMYPALHERPTEAAFLLICFSSCGEQSSTRFSLSSCGSCGSCNVLYSSYVHRYSSST